MIPGGPEQPDTVLLHYLLPEVMPAHPWSLHVAPKKPQSSFLQWSPHGLYTQVSPVQAQVLYVPSSATSGFVRGCPHLWKQREVSHTVFFFEHWKWNFFISALLKRQWMISFYFPAALCSCSSACTGWAVPHEPCSQQQSLCCTFVSQQLPGILKIYALFA